MNNYPYQWYPSSGQWHQDSHIYQEPSRSHQMQQLKQHTLATVEPFVQYGLKEAKHTSYLHAMREVAAISYLMGRGYDSQTAYRMVESWEVNEMFYP